MGAGVRADEPVLVGTMRARKWLSLLALAGVLVHAAALVRHHIVMLGAASQTPAVAALLADLSTGNFICHGNPAPADGEPQDLPSQANLLCPLCTGFAPLAALDAPEQVSLPCRLTAALMVAQADVATPPEQTIRPHSRGPPRA